MKRKTTLKTVFIVSLLAIGSSFFGFWVAYSNGDDLFIHGPIRGWMFTSIFFACFGIPLFLGMKRVVKWLIKPETKENNKPKGLFIRTIVVLVIFSLSEAALGSWSADNPYRLSNAPNDPPDIIVFMIMYFGFGALLYTLWKLLYKNKAPLSAITINNLAGKVATSVLLIFLGWLAYDSTEIGWIGFYKFFSQIGPFAILLLIIMIVGFGTPLLFWSGLITKHLRESRAKQS